MIIIAFGVATVYFGLILGSFLFIAGWFAWTPLPLAFRMPILLLLLAPYGLLAASLSHERELAFAVSGVLWLSLLAALFADRSASFFGCLGMLGLLCVVPLLVRLFFNSQATDELRPEAFGGVVILTLSISLICSSLRMWGYRLERLSIHASDETMRLLTEWSIDEWIQELGEALDPDATFAETMHVVRARGVPEETAKDVVNAVFRALGRTLPQLGSVRRNGTTLSVMQWATTGPGREQFSVRQLMLLVVASAILFATLAQTGIDSSVWSYFLAGIPAILSTGLSLSLLGYGLLLGKRIRYWFLCVSGACLIFGLGMLWIERMQVLPPRFWVVIPLGSVGAFGVLCYWMMHLRREGFRLIKAS